MVMGWRNSLSFDLLCLLTPDGKYLSNKGEGEDCLIVSS